MRTTLNSDTLDEGRCHTTAWARFGRALQQKSRLRSALAHTHVQLAQGQRAAGGDTGLGHCPARLPRLVQARNRRTRPR